MKVSILHITDLHADNRIAYFNDKVREIAKKINGFETNEVLLLFSGDLTQSGQNSQYNTVASFIKQIKASSTKKIYVACCPGNHDRSFGESESLVDEEIKKINSNNFSVFYEKYKHLGENFKTFEDSIGSSERINEVLSVSKFKIQDKLIKVYSLNNSLLSHFDPSKKEQSDNSNFERIFIPNEYLNIKRDNSYLCILLMHMPLHYFSQKTKQRLIDICNNNVDFIIDGHVHEDIVSKDCGDKKFLEFTSPALSSNETSGFTVFEVENERVKYFNYSFDNNRLAYFRTNNFDGQQVDFERKMGTFSNLLINKKNIDFDTDIKTTSGVIIKLDDVFVFPLLTSIKYLNSKNNHILSCSFFANYIKKHDAIQISSENDMGKTTLANRLFHYYAESGFMPVLCSGFAFAGYLKNKNKIDSYIDNQIRNCYLDSCSVEAFNDNANKGKRIIIIDDFDSYTEELINHLLKRFDKVVFFVDSKVKDLIRFSSIGGISSCKLEIEPMYKYKRQELFEKVYEVMEKRYNISSESLTKDNYLETFETYLSKIDKNNTLDPLSLIELATKVLLDSKNLANVHNLKYQEYYYDHVIEQAICSKNFKKCSTIVANRIISYIAYVCYKEEQNVFPISLISKSLEVEEEIYGGDNFTDCLGFADVLCEAGIFERVGEAKESLCFSKRKVLAYFVGKYAIERLHSFNDSELMDLIINRGVYTPLNFNILMSIASNYSYNTIPNYFVNDLYDEIMKTDLQLFNNFKSIKTYLKDDKQRLLDLSKEEKQRIKKEISKHEEANRKEYLKNAENFFYVEKMDDRTKEILDLYNKMTVVSSLLCSSDSILKNEKKKLAQLVIKLPNVIIDKYLSFIKNEISKLYIQIQALAKEDKNITQSDIDGFFDFLSSIIVAFILSVYDTSVRFLGRANISKEMEEQLNSSQDNEILSNMYSIQRLMLLSFTNKNVFAEETIKFIKENDKKNVFYSTQAKLIARRYYFDNEEYVAKYQKALLNAIGGYKTMKIAETKNKKIKQ